MDQTRKILLIDKATDRKQRIAALKERGFAVFPALKIAEARSRCKPGNYDLIVVHADEGPDEAVELCDSIRQRGPKQMVLLARATGAGAPDRDYVAPSDPQELASHVESLLRHRPAASGISLAA